MNARNSRAPRAGGGASGVAVAILICLFLLSPIAPIAAWRAMVATVQTPKGHWRYPLLGGFAASTLWSVVVDLLCEFDALDLNYYGLAMWLDAGGPFDASLLVAIACSVPLGATVGVMAGGALLFIAERSVRGVEYSPLEQRRLAQQTATAKSLAFDAAMDPANQALCLSPPLGIALGGDLDSCVSGPFVTPNKALDTLGIGIIGSPGSGKTTTIERQVMRLAQAGSQVVVLDCKGTDHSLPQRLAGSYLSANPNARIVMWPAQPLQGWLADPDQMASQLLAVNDGQWSEPFFQAATASVVKLAVAGDDGSGRGPCASTKNFFERLHPDFLRRAATNPTEAGMVEYLVKRPEILQGVVLRYYQFFASLKGAFDGTTRLEDADLIVAQLPALADQENVSAAVRMMLVLLGHYATTVKARGRRVAFIVDEFSAVTAAAPLVISLAERVRDSNAQVIVSVQGYQGLGEDDDQRRRMLEALAGGLIVHRCVAPSELLEVAGTWRQTEQSHQLDESGESGMGSVRMGYRMKVSPDAVRQAAVGEAWVLSNGRYAHMQVIPPGLIPSGPVRVSS